MSDNPLLTHVRRHQQMSIILRAAAVSPHSQQAGINTAVPLVRATLPGQSASFIAEAPVEMPAPTAVQRPQPRPAARPTAAALAPPPVQRQVEPVTPPAPVTQPAGPQPPPAQPASEEKPDPNWRRLQAIVNAHQRKQQTAEETQTPQTAEQPPANPQQTASAPAPKPPQPSPRAAKVLGRKPAPPRMPAPEEKKRAEITFLPSEKEQAQEIDQPQVEPTSPPNVELPPARPQQTTAVQRTVEPTAELSTPQPTDTTPAPVESGEIQEQPMVETAVSMPTEPSIEDTIISAPPKRPIPEPAVLQTPEQPEPPAQTAPPQPIENRPSAAPNVIQRQIIDESEQEASIQTSVETPPLLQHPSPRFDPETTIISTNPLPGQKGDIPHVQRQQFAADAAPDAAPHDEPEVEQSQPLEAVWPVQRLPEPRLDIQPPPTLPTGQRVQRDRAADSRVRESLETVAAGRPTDSGVELVLPKRPRPVPLQKKSSPIARKPIPQQPKTTQQTIQRQTVEPGVVHTEIGPLPGDLWQLLGQTPPVGETAVQETAPVNAPAQRAVGETAVPAPTPPTIQRQISGEPAPPATKVEAIHRTASPASPIQRAAIDAGSDVVQAESGGVEAETAAETAAKDENGQPDIEELSRQVYQRIKRYLAVERERGRGRF